MKTELTPKQLATVADSKLRLQKLLHFAGSSMKSSTVDLIKSELLNSQPGGQGTYISKAIATLKGSAFAKVLEDCLPVLFNLSGRDAQKFFGPNGLYPNLTDRERWKTSVEILTGVVASLEVAATVETNLWKQARELNPKITISDQMMTLFTKDESIVDRKNLSGEVARILGCSPQAVRHPDNGAWKYYRTEQARRKKTRQDLKGKRWVDSEQNDADD